jgi:hypothetical protein
MRRNGLSIRLPVVGQLRLPAKEDVVFLGGVTVLAVAGLVEWPVALILAIGHELAANRHNQLLHSFGEALEAA